MDEIVNCDKILNSPVPIVIKSTLDWVQLGWTLKDWRTKLHEPNKKYPFRRGVFKCSQRPQWERTCDVINLTIEEFFTLKLNTAGKLPEHWYYFDYKHLEQWFSHNISLQGMSWSCLGLDDVASSTIWIGSKGAHTPCHYDTYGHNLIAQLYGKKMWILFPPEMTNSLKPCRVPYEESSVYSNINFSCGCADISGISEVHSVILEPGDILYVPKNWWHYVENITTAISINTWLPKKSDNISRLEESLAKCIITSFLRDMTQSERDHILNPNEDDLPNCVNLEELTYCCEHCNEDPSSSLIQLNHVEISSSSIFQVNAVSCDGLTAILKNKCSYNSLCKNLSQEIIANKCLEIAEGSSVKANRSVLFEDIINVFCHPEVLSLVREKLSNVINDCS